MQHKIIYQLQELRWRLIHIFGFHKPLLEALEYEKVVLRDNGLLLLYWRTSHPSYLKIPLLNNYIFNNKGFIVVPLPAIGNVTVELCNTWRKQIFHIDLSRVDVRLERAERLTVQLQRISTVTNFRFFFKKVTPDNFSFTISEHRFATTRFVFFINDKFNFSIKNLENDHSLL